MQKELSTEQLTAEIVKGMQEKKARRIVVVDMSRLDAPCESFVICEADSTVQTAAIALSVRDEVRDNAGAKPYAMDGMDNATWIAIDYGHIIVHVFQRESREFYDIEHLWADARLEEVPDLD